jgi:hypothetical protein
METQHNETVMEKVTAYVKEILGMPEAESMTEAKPDYNQIVSVLHSADHSPWPTTTALEPTVENPMRLESAAEKTKNAALIDPEDAALMRREGRQ